MLWNTIDRTTVTGNILAYFKPASFTARLTWLYTFIVVAVLCTCAFFMYGSLVKGLDRKDIAAMTAEADHIMSLLADNPVFLGQYLAMIEWDKTGIPARNASHHARVCDEAGRMIAQSPFFYTLDPAIVFPRGTSPQKRIKKWRSPDGRSFLLIAVSGREGDSLKKTRIIQLAKDISDNDALSADYREKLLGSLAAAILLCIGIGFSFTRKMAGPLETITEAAERTSVSLTAERLDPAGWPTELRSLAIAFNGMLDRLEQSIARLHHFSSDLAHELRTPVTRLIGKSEIALYHGGTPDEFRQTLASNLEELTRLSGIIDRLLFLARTENPKTRIECSRFDVYDEVQKLCSFFEWTAAEQGITLTCSGRGVIVADRLLISRAVSNLISNALKYTPEPGRVEVIVRQQDDQVTEITVHDTGLGIEENDLPYVCDRFFRAGSTPSKSQGTGLGLAIVKSIMDLHGATIDIQSTPGLGTDVTLRFTCQQTL